MTDTHNIQPEPFEFRGSAGQWFGIWIVNLLLTIVTVGIYSAWAKVRTKKYFYQHTYVAGRNFDYHATGLQILIGRIIVVAAFIVYSLVSALAPVLAIAMPILLLVAFPFLLVRSLRFNAQMSSWSNVRFRFSGTAGKAALVYLLYPILTALTLYLTFPILDRAMKRFSITNHSLGDADFEFDAPLGRFYGAFLAAFAWVLFVTIVLVAVMGVQIAAFDFATFGNDPASATMFFVVFYAFVFLAFFPAFTIYQAFIRNTVYNNTTLEGGHRFYSNVSPLQLFWIALSNAVLVMISLGLLLPFAQVRISKYLANHTTLIPNGPLDHFLSRMDRQATAIGDAYTDIEGIDVGMPI